MKKEIIIFIVTFLFLSGCGKDTGEVKLAEADNGTSLYWEKSVIDTTELDSVYMACMVENTIYIATYPMHGADDEGKDFRFRLYQMDTSSDGSWQELNYRFSEEERIMGMEQTKGGVMLFLSDKRGEAAEYAIVVLDKEGNEVSRREITDSGNELAQNAFLGEFCADSDGNIYFLLPTEIWRLGKDNSLASLDSCKSIPTGLEALEDERTLFLQMYDDSSLLQDVEGKESYRLPLERIKTVSGLLPEPQFFSDKGIYKMTGSGKDLCLEQVVDFVDCGLQTANMEEVMYSAGGEYYILIQDDSPAGFAMRLIRLRPTETAEAAQKQTIRMGGYLFSDDVRRAVNIYNRSQDECTIALVEYGDDEAGRLQFSTDIISESCPDLFCMENGERDILQRNGILEALDELSEEELLDNVVRAYSRGDGKIFAISPGFIIRTTVTKQSRLGDVEKLTLSAALALSEKSPGKPLFGKTTADQLLANMYLANRAFLFNREEKSCRFDSEEFGDLLRLSKDGASKENGEASAPLQLKNNQAFMVETEIFEPNDFMLYTRMFDEPVAFIGYPVAEESGGAGTMLVPMGGSFGISSLSDNKEKAWDFIKMVLGSEYQKSQCYPRYFPVRKDSMKYMLMLVSAEEEKTLEDGTHVRKYESEVGYDDYFVTITAMTDKERQQFYKLLELADNLYAPDKRETDIVLEEAEGYFAGNRTLQDVQQYVQGRMTTLLNE